MAKKESGVCRICTESDEKSETLEFVYSFLNIVTEIKDTLGIEILIGPDTPTYVCHECITALENAQKFRQKCIRSNEYFTSICLSGNEGESSDSSKGTKCNESKRFPLETPTSAPALASVEAVIHTDQSAQLELKTNSLSDEILSDEIESIANKDDNVQEHSDNLVGLEKLAKITNSEKSQTRNNAKERIKCNAGRKQKGDKSIAPVICDICGNVFKAKHVFALHLRRHSDVKPYDCELCSSRFYTNSELKRHMRKHTGEKPYECQYCQRRFSDYGTLTKHTRTHTNDRPFPCKQCGKSFSCTFVLKNHMLIHTGERAFRCEVCDKAFGRLHNLTTHMKSIYHQRNICMKENKVELSS